MTIQLVGEHTQFIATSRDILHSHGLTLTFGADFDEYRELVKRYRPQQPVGHPFDPDAQEFTEDNAFWLVAQNQEGEVVSTQAAKTIDMQGQTLAGYLMRTFRDYPPALPDIDLPRSRFRATPGTYQVEGSVVYHGDVWLAPSPIYRGTGLLTVMARTLLLEATLRWDPDFAFGFIANAPAFKGLGERMGYFHIEPGAVRWFRENSDKPIEGFIAYLSRFDLSYLLDINLSDIVPQAA